MGKEKSVGPGFAVALITATVVASLYFTGKMVEAQESYFHVFTMKMDQAIADAYSIPAVY